MKNELVRKKLVEKWGAERLWTPLDGEKASDTVDYFEYDEFELAFGLEKLKQTLKELESEPIHEISEIHEDRIISISEMEDYGGVEMFYTNSEADWVIYMSHENTITISGAKLLETLKKKWSEYSDFNKPWEK